MKIYIVVIISFLIVSLAGYFIYKDRMSKPAKIEPQKLISVNVGIDAWVGDFLVPLASNLGYFREEGLDLKYTVYDEFDKIRKDANSGVIQIRSDVLSGALRDYRDFGLNQLVFLVADQSLGSDGIVARKGAPNLENAKKPKFLFGSGSTLTPYAAYALSKFSLKAKDIQIIEGSTEEDSVNRFLAGEADYIMTFEPYLSRALAGGGKLIQTSADIPGAITDVFVVHTKFLKENPRAVDAFLRAYFRAYDYWKTNPESSYKIVAPVFGVAIEDVKGLLKGIKVYDAKLNNNAFGAFPGLESVSGNLQIMQKLLNEIEYEKAVNVDDVIYASAIKDYAKEHNIK